MVWFLFGKFDYIGVGGVSFWGWLYIRVYMDRGWVILYGRVKKIKVIDFDFKYWVKELVVRKCKSVCGGDFRRLEVGIRELLLVNFGNVKFNLDLIEKVVIIRNYLFLE